MNVYIVDDEKIVLEDTKRSVLKALGELNVQVDNLVATQSWRQALILAEDSKPDIAFLDISMPGKNGLDLGKEFQAINPKVNLIYITAYEEYAIQAYRIHASGYLLKPVDANDVIVEMNNLRHGADEAEGPVFRVQCFGNFEVFYEDKAITFRRQKTKELLAFLVDRKGASVSTEEICASIFDGDGTEDKHKNTLRVLSMELKQIFENCKLPEAYVHTRNAYAIAPNLIECDYYDYLKGKPLAAQKYAGEYMKQYSAWARMQKE